MLCKKKSQSYAAAAFAFATREYQTYAGPVQTTAMASPGKARKPAIAAITVGLPIDFMNIASGYSIKPE